MIRKIAASLMLAATIAGCQTQYQEMSFTGGVSAQPITSDTYRIVSRGNGYTDATTVQDYSLLKAAETTLSTGNTHFLLLSGSDATQNEVGQTAGYMQTNVYGNTATAPTGPELPTASSSLGRI